VWHVIVRSGVPNGTHCVNMNPNKENDVCHPNALQMDICVSMCH
jgi:hypothetical protein